MNQWQYTDDIYGRHAKQEHERYMRDTGYKPPRSQVDEAEPKLIEGRCRHSVFCYLGLCGHRGEK